MVFIRVLIFLTTFTTWVLPQAEAYNLLSTAQRLAQTVQERTNSSFPNQADYEQVWLKKCGKPTNVPVKKCLLTENDVFGEKGRKDHILLFRGESKIFAYPSTSSLLRNVINDETKICDVNCELDQLLKILKFDLAQVIEEKIKLDAKAKPINYLLTGHVSSNTQYFFTKKDGSDARLDALVSYSYSPYVAGRFSFDGRVIVTSVAKSRIKACANYEMTADELIDSSSCEIYLGRDENYDNELEVDYLLITNPDDVLDVYKHLNVKFEE